MSEGFFIDGVPMSKAGHRVEVKKVPLNKIKLGKNSRLNIDPEELSGLMQSIKEEGLLQPIGVVRTNGHFEVCYGNRRFLACSKLGLANIPCIIHDKGAETDVDIKNLTENVQRRNVSLIEVGRYATLLQEKGLSLAEIGVRMGVSRDYISSCLVAYSDIPKEFQDALDIRVGRSDGSTGVRGGKISVKTAKQIISANKSGLITRKQTKEMFRAAKSGELNPEMIGSAVAAASRGAENYLDKGHGVVNVFLRFAMKKTEKEKLMAEFVDEGPFRNFGELLVAILSGEKNHRVKILKKL